MILYRPAHFLFSMRGLYQTTASVKGLPLSIRTASGGTGVRTSLIGTQYSLPLISNSRQHPSHQQELLQ
jgi:hypothetical protein